ncbi:MAG: M48 family metallopeptidase [Thermoleophilia bacterium]
MNAYGAIILAAILLEAGARRYADLRNLRALRDELPSEFVGVYDADDYARSQRYTRERTRLGTLAAAIRLGALLVFWFAGGFAWLDGVVAGLEIGPVGRGLVFIGALVGAQALPALPLRAYSTFVLEARYGFNKTTVGVFVADMLKGAALAVVLGGVLLAGVLALLVYAGPWAWLYAWVAASVFLTGVQFVLPTWIMPLFNTYTPLEDGELRRGISAYAESVGFPLGAVLVMDGSRRSSRANAFFTGFGRTRRIAVFDTLIEQHPVPELLAVIAHELGHWRERHVLKGMALSVLQLGVTLALLSWALEQRGLFAAFGVETPSVYTGLVFFLLLITPIEFALSIGLNALSRRHERQADAFASRTTGSPESMVSALKTLAKNNLANLTPDRLYVALTYSHPPVLERIVDLRERSGSLGASE